MRRLWLVLLFLGLTAPAGAQGAGSVTAIRGRLVDGTAMLQSGGAAALDRDGFRPDAERIAAGGRRVRLHLTAPPGTASGPWEATTDDDGRFLIPLDGLAALPRGARIVAEAPAADGQPALYSLEVDPAAAPAGGEIEFRAYKTTADSRFLRDSRLEVYFTLADDPQSGRKLLVGRLFLTADNLSGELYTGSRLRGGAAGGSAGNILVKFPLPDGAVVVRERTAPEWTITPAGWALLDSPLPPFPEAPGGSRYRLEFQTPAYQEMTFALPVDLPLDLVSVWAVPDIMDMVSPDLRGPDRFNQPDPDEPGGVQKSWVLLWNQRTDPGRTHAVGLTIDNLPLRQVNRKSLLIVVGFILAALIAVLAGLILGWRGPRVEAVLSEASGEEIIERIAQLDAQFERGLVAKADYHETRERLLALARYEVPELAAAQSKGLAALPPRARELVLRLRQLERDGAGDPRRIQERLLLLEDLSKVLLESAEKERPQGGGERGPGGQSGHGGSAPEEARR